MADATRKRPKKPPGKLKFRHPGVGAAIEVPKFLAVFWAADTTASERGKLLKELGLEFAKLPDAKSPAAQVNQTDRLSWVTASRDELIGKEAADKLRAHDAVEWVSLCFCKDQGKSNETNYFTINPQRLYLRESALAGASGASDLHPGLTKNESRSAHLHGLIALSVEDGDAIAVARSVNRRLAQEGAEDQVRFETIPFLSPTCHANPCSPPTSEYIPNDSMFGTQWGLQRTEIAAIPDALPEDNPIE